MKKLSAGILMYRKRENEVEVLLVHPGGPLYKNKDDGSWDIPKGQPNDDEEAQDLEGVARREFEEETSFKVEGSLEYLASVVRKDGKEMNFWVTEGDVDVTKIRSNTTFIEWPPKSGQKMEILEIDRGEFYTLEVAKKKAYPSLLPIFEAFEKYIK